MQQAKVRLVWLAVTAALFLAWIGWMAWEVAHKPVVLAHAPFLVADLNVVASVKDLNDPVKIDRVAWARNPADDRLAGQEVRVTNLPRCRADWRGPGEYILPLLKTGEGTYEVADATGLSTAQKERPSEAGRLPRSPGYDGDNRPPHIYRSTDETRAQLEHLHH